jgi:hypothetical protein
MIESFRRGDTNNIVPRHADEYLCASLESRM